MAKKKSKTKPKRLLVLARDKKGIIVSGAVKYSTKTAAKLAKKMKARKKVVSASIKPIK